jgi:glutathione S-transferase
MIEIHGKRECPFAWRVRICAREKGVSFDWVPFDVPSPDERATRSNPERESPKLVSGHFQLTESLVIIQYLDEAYAGPALQPLSARDRALMRLRLYGLSGMEQHVTPRDPPDQQRLRTACAELERGLADGRAWLGGSSPDLSDVAVWPFLWTLEKAGVPVGPAAYLDRVRKRPSLLETRPR